ncbi:carboxypeptidase [Colletotrichum truncatum]|uniref:Carboxypeptidase n=1 Tax=Colletotrichum truncatum TaxID=5467 RepID=A0ACC3YFA7_COLTU|nr:carboxypeptidase [Colletotrichum truncatum]KAF6788270.1 carboxypeptidase [Colletotrichum truncatum]
MRTVKIAATVLAALPLVSAWVTPYGYRASLADRHIVEDLTVKATQPVRRADLQYFTDKTSPFYVDGAKIPEVSFDVGESYAGLIPIDATKPQAEQKRTFFWFFPTQNPAGKDEIIIWLNGGPGCSSMEGFMQENGPFMWQYGTYKPVANPYSWHKLANVIWVEYPTGTGFSAGNVTAKNNVDAAEEFLGFWENFVKTFNLQGKKIYITGESYSGIYVPYVGAAMLDRNDTSLFNVNGALYYNPIMPYFDNLGLGHAAFPAYFRYWENIFGLPNSVKAQLEKDNQECKFDEYLNKHLSFPPPAMPWPATQKADNCDILKHFNDAIYTINPCFNTYHIMDQCPVLWDVLGFPQVPYSPEGHTIYFNIPEVRKTVHVPLDHPEWVMCKGPVFVDGKDNYDGAEHERKFQTLVERTNNVHVSSGLADFVVQPNVTALGIQRTTWNGKQGFQTRPSTEFVIPPVVNDESNIPSWAGANVQGVVHTERGLTWSTAKLAGHMVPQYSPSSSLRHVEHLLGRVKSLTSGEGWSIKISANFSWPF